MTVTVNLLRMILLFATMGLTAFGSIKAFSLIDMTILDYVLWGLYIIICLGILFDVLEMARRGTNMFKNGAESLYSDYEEFYKLNGIPVAGQCRICGRPIPQYYVEPSQTMPNLLKNQICFQVDGIHVDTLQKLEDKSAFADAQQLMKRIKTVWNTPFVTGIIIGIVAIVVESIMYGYVSPLFYNGDCHMEGYNLVCDFNYSVGAFLVLFPGIILVLGAGAGALTVGRKNAFMIKRLYKDHAVKQITECLLTGTPLPPELAAPPNFNAPGDKLPGFFEALKTARKMAGSIKSIAGGVAGIASAKNVTDVISSVKGIGSGYKELKGSVEEAVDQTVKSPDKLAAMQSSMNAMSQMLQQLVARQSSQGSQGPGMPVQPSASSQQSSRAEAAIQSIDANLKSLAASFKQMPTMISSKPGLDASLASGGNVTALDFTVKSLSAKIDELMKSTPTKQAFDASPITSSIANLEFAVKSIATKLDNFMSTVVSKGAVAPMQQVPAPAIPATAALANAAYAAIAPASGIPMTGIPASVKLPAGPGTVLLERPGGYDDNGKWLNGKLLLRSNGLGFSAKKTDITFPLLDIAAAMPCKKGNFFDVKLKNGQVCHFRAEKGKFWIEKITGLVESITPVLAAASTIVAPAKPAVAAPVKVDREARSVVEKIMAGMQANQFRSVKEIASGNDPDQVVSFLNMIQFIQSHPKIEIQKTPDNTVWAMFMPEALAQPASLAPAAASPAAEASMPAPYVEPMPPQAETETPYVEPQPEPMPPQAETVESNVESPSPQPEMPVVDIQQPPMQDAIPEPASEAEVEAPKKKKDSDELESSDLKLDF